MHKYVPFRFSRFFFFFFFVENNGVVTSSSRESFDGIRKYLLSSLKKYTRYWKRYVEERISFVNVGALYQC